MNAIPGTVEAIIRKAVAVTGVTRAEIMGNGRQRPITRVRFAICFAARRSLGKSTPMIGRALGGRDHSSVLYALRRAEELIAEDQDFAQLCSALEVA